jgi:hypothetical protein
MKVTLIFRGADRGSAFTPGKRYCFRLEELPQTGVIFMEGQTVRVAYKDWPTFHRNWQVVAGKSGPDPYNREEAEQG